MSSYEGMVTTLHGARGDGCDFSSAGVRLPGRWGYVDAEWGCGDDYGYGPGEAEE